MTTPDTTNMMTAEEITKQVRNKNMETIQEIKAAITNTVKEVRTTVESQVKSFRDAITTHTQEVKAQLEANKVEVAKRVQEGKYPVSVETQPPATELVDRRTFLSQPVDEPIHVESKELPSLNTSPMHTQEALEVPPVIDMSNVDLGDGNYKAPTK